MPWTTIHAEETPLKDLKPSIVQIAISGNHAYRVDPNMHGIFSLDLSGDFSESSWTTLKKWAKTDRIAVSDKTCFQGGEQCLWEYNNDPTTWKQITSDSDGDLLEVFVDPSLSCQKLFCRLSSDGIEAIKSTDMNNPGSFDTLYTNGDIGNRNVKQFVAADNWVAFLDSYGTVCLKSGGGSWKEVYSPPHNSQAYYLEKYGDWLYAQVMTKDSSQDPAVYTSKLQRMNMAGSQSWENLDAIGTFTSFAADGANVWTLNAGIFSYYDNSSGGNTPFDPPPTPTPPTSANAANDPPQSPLVFSSVAAYDGKLITNAYQEYADSKAKNHTKGFVFLYTRP